MTALHQFVPTFEPGAVGGHIRQVRAVARDLGLDAEVFAEHLRGPVAGEGRPFHDYGRRVPAGPDDILLYHVAIGSVVADFVLDRPERLVVDHHNITPERYFADWEPPVVYGLQWGRAQLARLAARAELGLADSGYNEGELRDLGCPRTAVVPILLDLDSFDRDVDGATADRLRAGGGRGTAWLFVGRVAPNKAHHDLIKAFAVYRRVYDPAAVLRLVGSSSSDTYVDALRAFVSSLQLDGAVEITGGVSDAALAAHYQAADAFVCLSEHEGFCIPLLEAMHHRVPVVAFAAAAVPETLGAGGLCLPTKAATTVAAAVWRVRSDEALRTILVDAGTARLADFALPRTRARLVEALRPLIGP